MPERVLLVDDDENVLDSYRRRLGRVMHVETNTDPVRALELVKQSEPFAVIISDHMMPRMTGVEFLTECYAHSPDSIRMMLTGASDFESAIEAVNSGNIFRFLLKPCPSDVLGNALVDGVRQYRMVRARQRLVADAVTAAARVCGDLGTLRDPDRLARSHYLRFHVRSAADRFAPQIANAIESGWIISSAAATQVPDATLERIFSGEPVDDAERKPVEEQLELLCGEFDAVVGLEDLSDSIRYQFLGMDGSGLPAAGPGADALPIGARILGVFQAIDLAMRKTGSVDGALAQLEQQAARYDRRIIARVRTGLTEELGSVGTDPKWVYVDDLLVGDLLGGDIKDQEGNLVLGTGTRLTPMLLAHVRRAVASGSVSDGIAVLRPPEIVDIDVD